MRCGCYNEGRIEELEEQQDILQKGEVLWQVFMELVIIV